MTNFYVALGRLRKLGFDRFETITGDIRTFDQLRHAPPVADPRAYDYYPTNNGELRRSDGLKILSGKKMTTKEKPL